MNNFTDKDVDYIINSYKNNISIDALMGRYDCEEKDIRKVLKDNQIDRQYNTFK